MPKNCFRRFICFHAKNLNSLVCQNQAASADFWSDFRFETLSGRPLDRNYMSESVVDPDEVEHVADLARVSLDADERRRFAAQFADILSSFETLDEVPTIEPDAELTNVMRSDEVEASLDQEQALQNAPDSEDGFFKGPRVS